MASDSDEIEYQSLQDNRYRQKHRVGFTVSQDQEYDDESDISLHEEQGFLVHMSPEANKSQWNHVDDLDKFFISVYDYHQRHGFQNMVLGEVLQIIQFVFIVVFVTFLSWCVNYPELFDEIPHNVTHKKTFDDIIYSSGTCIARFNTLTWMLLVLCSVFLAGRGVKMIVNFSNYLRTRNFFISALNIETKELSNMTWHEVQSRLLEVQKEQQICIHKQELTQLDIYHRILRFKNYIVAMVNKDLLPLKANIPLLGQHALLTHGMRFNLDCLLYWSPWSIFMNSYTLRSDYKSHQKRNRLADQLSRHITILALLNFILCPLIFLYQIIYFFFRYTEIVKRAPGFLGSRQWANYGRVYLRHFNELDHELNARLNRAYVPSKMYINTFTSPSLVILAKYIAFFAGAPAAILFVFGVLDLNDVTKVEHLFTVASICGMVATISSSLIPDENEVYCPERLLMSILAQIHYMPSHWKGRAHTLGVRDEFATLFQYKLVYILEELLSPLFTPIWLFFCLRPKSAQIVDFYRCFTVEVAGVGDVCSFAQMDIKKHGNPQWKAKVEEEVVSRSQQAENGKTELSLMHFTTTNPEWKPPQPSNVFVNEVKSDVHRDMPILTSMMADPLSLPSLGYVNPIDPTLLVSQSMRHSTQILHDMPQSQMSSLMSPNPKLVGGMASVDGPIVTSTLPMSMSVSGSFHSANFAPNFVDEGHREFLSGNMSLSVLHLHDMHHRNRRGGGSGGGRMSSGHGHLQGHGRDFSLGSGLMSQATRNAAQMEVVGIGMDRSSKQNQQPPLPQHQASSSSRHVTDPLASMATSMSLSADSDSQQQQQQREFEYSSLPHHQQHPSSRLSTMQSHPGGYDEPLNAPFANPLSHELGGSSEFASLPPLEIPYMPTSLSRQGNEGTFSMSTTGAGAVPSSINRPVTSDPMPQIKEEASGEHEIDTSQH